MYHEHPEEIAERRQRFQFPNNADRFTGSDPGRVILFRPDAPPLDPVSRIQMRATGARCSVSLQKPKPAALPPTPRQLEAIEYAGKGFTAKQVAEIMGNTVGCVKELIKHGRRRQRALAAK